MDNSGKALVAIFAGCLLCFSFPNLLDQRWFPNKGATNRDKFGLPPDDHTLHVLNISHPSNRHQRNSS
jgi:hypothetical protein